ncbi:YeeE/YedE family protein [Aureimonas fodinaquatilis]|uniref:YeeE/YedE family protein n=1 Tax=Aureimonas fodinaquatilis TaxID=2565783 RepID=A0A5B0DU93_9HYPH|nr:YeeE/YedE family protein [Aureimonas fodinaquatilis]KAA0969341.1 YeeE/YedE family protein [Aureimonas fodinaquatilis]
MSSVVRRVLLPVGIVVAIALVAWLVHARPGGRDLSFSLLAGAAFGLVLQRARFCFLCNFRDFIEKREPQGLLAIIIALAAGVVLYYAVIMAWVPVPQPERLPPNAHIGPVGPVLALAAFVFGIGMAISGSCLSAHFYRLGEGSPSSPFALIGAAIGFVIGFLTWNSLFTLSIYSNEALWLPHSLGYSATILLSLGLCALLAFLVLYFASGKEQTVTTTLTLKSALASVFVNRWPPAVAGIAVAAISAFAYFRVAPLGVTAELGSIARTAGTSAGWLPETLHGLDGLRGCATVIKQALLSNNGLFVMGLIAASFASALAANKFQPQRPRPGQIISGLTGGILMGWGAMTGLGCTVGVLLSGIHAGAVSGWVFLIFCTAGVWLGLMGMRRFARRAA